MRYIGYINRKQQTHLNLQLTWSLRCYVSIKDRYFISQKQVVNTIYNRAKYHPHQTDAMREAMKVFEKWLQKNIKKQYFKFIKYKK